MVHIERDLISGRITAIAGYLYDRILFIGHVCAVCRLNRIPQMDLNYTGFQIIQGLLFIHDSLKTLKQRLSDFGIVWLHTGLGLIAVQCNGRLTPDIILSFYIGVHLYNVLFQVFPQTDVGFLGFRRRGCINVVGHKFTFNLSCDRFCHLKFLTFYFVCDLYLYLIQDTVINCFPHGLHSHCVRCSCLLESGWSLLSVYICGDSSLFRQAVQPVSQLQQKIAVGQPAVIRKGRRHRVHGEIVSAGMVTQQVLLDQAVSIAGQAITGARRREIHMDISINQKLRYFGILRQFLPHKIYDCQLLPSSVCQSLGRL
nr:MAG TPA: hypothetical protein [Caudoviricetes sp.]